jgi:hypothetical protein
LPPLFESPNWFAVVPWSLCARYRSAITDGLIGTRATLPPAPWLCPVTALPQGEEERREETGG